VIVLILDSSFLVAYHNKRDAHHPAAARIMERLLAGEWGRALVLEYVFLEVVTVLLARRGRETASRVATTLLESREVDLVPCSEIFLEAFETFRSQKSSAFSFADAAIVAVARGMENAVVATFDTDFQDLPGITVVPA